MNPPFRSSVLARRTLLGGAVAGAAAGLIGTLPASRLLAQDGAGAPAGTSPEKGARLILLGTKGGPRVGGARSNPANALVVDGNLYIIDCGMGVTAQAVKAGLDLSKLRDIFISHMHSDHELEFGNLVYNTWAAGQLRQPVNAYGPKGLADMARDYWASNSADIHTRIADEGRVDPATLLKVHEFDAATGPVMDDGVVKVTAFTTPHPPLKDLAYRFETAYGTIVISGDTAFNPALAEFARDCDVLVHETLYVPGVDALVKRAHQGAEFRNHLLSSHTSAQDVGKIATMARAKKLVLTHFVPGDMDWITDQMWHDAAATNYSGEIVVGHDLQSITLG
ncbi:MBL fold metallo-hydrolase [Novosphingobium profundi]|uniref:MBL fold metallo-hydrolase n=1 Tax=Novosphingobium profundi TaxID=1774954 RepID=UPI001BDAA9C2|nr:MBL fold metallo-hydrolase [Novosphingobium profundi]MBT0669246.1 MBL fold metallo-hydrolase [Novosphingobium profundi]